MFLSAFCALKFPSGHIYSILRCQSKFKDRDAMRGNTTSPATERKFCDTYKSC